MAINMRARAPYRDRWPSKPEFMRDAFASPACVGFCALLLGFGLGITVTLWSLGRTGAWQPLAFAVGTLALFLGGVRFVLEAYYDQEIRPRSEENDRRYGLTIHG